MIISMSWLKNHLSTKANIKQIVERLTEIGLEVESVKAPDSDLDNFVICKIVKSKSNNVILYSPRNDIGGSVVCHIGEAHLGKNAKGNILDLLY